MVLVYTMMILIALGFPACREDPAGRNRPPSATVPPPQVTPGPGETLPTPLSPNAPAPGTTTNRPNPPSGLPQ